MEEKEILSVCITDNGIQSMYHPENDKEVFMIASFLAMLFHSEKGLFFDTLELMMDEDFVNVMKDHTSVSNIEDLFKFDDTDNK